MRNELKKVKQKYFDMKDEVNVTKANGNLARLCNLRDAFDETFDGFFDQRELREKYNAWDEEHNRPNFDITAATLEEQLDDEDIKALIEFYEIYICNLEEELIELQSPEEI